MNMCATQQQVNPNTQEFLTLYQENLARVYHFVYIKVKNREVSEDLTVNNIANGRARKEQE